MIQVNFKFRNSKLSAGENTWQKDFAKNNLKNIQNSDNFCSM